MRHRVDVLTGSTDKKWQLAARPDSGDGFGCGALEDGQTPGLVGIGHVDQMVRNAGAFCGRWLGSADVHAAIEETRIRRDDFDVKTFGK